MRDSVPLMFLPSRAVFRLLSQCIDVDARSQPDVRFFPRVVCLADLCRLSFLANYVVSVPAIRAFS